MRSYLDARLELGETGSLYARFQTRLGLGMARVTRTDSLEEEP